MTTLRELIKRQLGLRNMLKCEECGEFFAETPDRIHGETYDGWGCGGTGVPAV